MKKKPRVSGQSVVSVDSPALYDETNVPPPEYRVRAVVRYAVMRYCHGYVSRDGKCASGGHSELLGEFHNEQRAFETAQALARAEGSTVSL